MASQVDIYNLALGNIGNSEAVASLEEKSQSRVICSRYWEQARDITLAQFDWPFATRYETLALIGEAGRNWKYQYQYPTDCLRAMFVTLDGVRRPPAWARPKFETGYGAGGQVIYSDHKNAELAYIARVEDTGRFPPLFVDALAWKLASLIAMPITNTRTIAESASQAYIASSQVAWASALNESETDTGFIPDTVIARFE